VPDLKSFERFLVSSGVVAEDRLERARGEARKRGATLTEVVQQLGFATAEQVYQALASFCELRYVVP